MKYSFVGPLEAVKTLSFVFLVLGTISALQASSLALQEVQQGQRPSIDKEKPMAMVVRSGSYTFYLNARNRHFRSIYQGRARAQVTGSMARISLEVPGYETAEKQVFLRKGVNQYTVQMTLEDPDVAIAVLNQNNLHISHRSDVRNNLVAANQFRIVSRIKSEGYARFDRFDVEFRVNGISSFGQRIQVRDLGHSKEVEVTFRRQDLRRFYNRISIYIPDDETMSSGFKAAAKRVEFRKSAYEELFRDL